MPRRVALWRGNIDSLIGASGRPRLQRAGCRSVPDDETVTRGVADPRPNGRSVDRARAIMGTTLPSGRGPSRCYLNRSQWDDSHRQRARPD